jgi:hypothetical protein
MKKLIFVLMAASAALSILFIFHLGCSTGESGDAGTDGGADAGSFVRREQHGKLIVAWLEGTPYEMGFQHGRMMKDEIKSGMRWIENDPTFSLLFTLSRSMGLVPIAEENSYPDIKEECQGMVAGVNSPLFTYEKCILLNFGDVLLAFIENGIPANSCSQVVATGKATSDGRMYHSRLLDWDKIQYMLDYPTIFVRKPVDGIPHVIVGFPANLSPYTGMNAEGIAISSNAAGPHDKSQLARTGRSHVQMLGQILKHAHDMGEVRQIITSSKHMTVEIFGVSDGKGNAGSVFEMSAKCIGERKLDETGVVFVTNHFLSPEAKDCSDEGSDSSRLRYARYQQLVPKDAKDWEGKPSSYYGDLGPETLLKVMRDRVNPYDGTVSSPDVFDNGKGIALNGAIFAVIFDPEKKWLWVSAGTIPVPSQAFAGFSLPRLLGAEGAQEVSPAEYPAEKF